MNLWGKRNNTNWSVDSKAKKENHINISINGKDYNDLIRRYKYLDREIKRVSRQIQDLTTQYKELSNKMSNLTNR